jgi:hypothetical protein
MKINLHDYIKIETEPWTDGTFTLLVLAIVAWYVGVPRWIALSIIGVGGLSMIGWLIHRRYLQICPQSQSITWVNRLGISRYEVEEVLAFYTYQEVDWIVMRNRDCRDDSWTTSPDAIWIMQPPRCPVCRLELEQQKSFWYGFVWRCIRGDFKKRCKPEFRKVAARVRILV